MKSRFLTLCFLFFVFNAPVAAAELQTVSSVDLERYLGRWFEVARMEQRFQKGCYDSIADYSRRDDGDIKVVNSCSILGKKGKKATGRAWVTDKDTNAKLRVQFALTGIKLSFMSGRYWVLDLAEDYSHVIVGEPSRKYLWILSRSPEIAPQRLEELLKKAELLGYKREEIFLNRDLQPDLPKDGLETAASNP